MLVQSTIRIFNYQYLITQYSYKVKIINQSEIVCCHLHGFTSRFDSGTAVRATLVDELGDHVPKTTDFNVRYYGGKQQLKIWLVGSGHDVQPV